MYLLIFITHAKENHVDCGFFFFIIIKSCIFFSIFFKSLTIKAKMSGKNEIYFMPRNLTPLPANTIPSPPPEKIPGSAQGNQKFSIESYFNCDRLT